MILTDFMQAFHFLKSSLNVIVYSNRKYETIPSDKPHLNLVPQKEFSEDVLDPGAENSVFVES